ncbi:hypothetical protein C453_18074 [Haloferax elongans ATCC BAA-1513]|uniref:SHOCT domain-containing protein n=1 Tax=Haloferax elongans ATCC BAA-1513 TaxID=1230453 RepID=M0HFU4_HALEO|nr:SHOCT domain-containing protein [Haloferax elongans]ELZ81949.1 hypothetical protein C453_18074 [Haloferax elongans ATCC BAA-1513]
MSSFEALQEGGVGGFVHDHPWLFAVALGLVGAGLAVSNSVNPLPAFTNMFLLGAVVGLAYAHATDIVSFAHDAIGSDADTDTASADQPLHELRERYATGELTEAEFERKLDHLLETESVEATEDYVSKRERERDTATE